MLSEATSTEIFSKVPKVPRSLFDESALRPILNELQYDSAIHTEADDIATFVVDAPGITYCEAVVTIASERSMRQPVSHSVLVPLRVLKLLSSIRPMNLKPYSLTFQPGHLFLISRFINDCVETQPPPPRGLFMSDEQPPWKAMNKACSKLFDARAQPPPPITSVPKPPGMKPPPSMKPVPKPQGMKPPPSMKPPKSMKPRMEPPGIKPPKPILPPPMKWPGGYVSGRLRSAPRYFDRVRSEELKYRRGWEIMSVCLRDSQVYIKSQPLPKSVLKVLTKYSVKAGPFGEIGLRSADNEDESSNGMPGLNELIRDVNDGIQTPVRWLLSHVFNGRISGSTAEDSKTSWFPHCSPEAPKVHVPLLLRRVTDTIGPLLLDSNGSIVLPVLGSEKVGKLNMSLENGPPSSVVRVEWKPRDYDEEFSTDIREELDYERLRLC